MFKKKAVVKNAKGILQPLLIGLLVLAAFAIGSMWTELRVLKSGNGTPAGQPAPAAQEPSVPKEPKVTLDQVKELFQKDLIKFGDENKELLFVEIADPSCPYCHVTAGKNPELNRQMDPITNSFKLTTDGGKYLAPEPEIRKLVDQKKAGLVYLYNTGHGNGEIAMKAMYCAYEEGKFWEAHDLLMTNAGYKLINDVVKNDPSQTQKMVDFLKKAVDPVKLKQCLDSGKYDSRPQSDEALAVSLVGGSTPSFIINGKVLIGAQPYTAFQAMINEALK